MPTPPLHYPSLTHFFPFPSLLRPPQVPQIQLGSLGERCNLPCSVWGGASAEIEFGAFQL